MSVSIIDGTITEAVPGRKAWGVRFFKRLDFRLADGSSQSVTRAVVHSDLADKLQPGTSGRFYLFKAYDHRGLHGYRDAEGRGGFHFPRNNEVMLAIVMVPVSLWVLYVLFAWAGLPIFWTILLILGIFSLFHYRKVRHEAERQFAADGAHRAPGPLPTAASPAAGT